MCAAPTLRHSTHSGHSRQQQVRLNLGARALYKIEESQLAKPLGIRLKPKLKKVEKQKRRIAKLQAQLFALQGADTWSGELAHELLPLVRPSRLSEERESEEWQRPSLGLRVRGDTLSGAGGALFD